MIKKYYKQLQEKIVNTQLRVTLLAQVAIFIVVWCIQLNVFVRPVTLEKTHREILSTVSEKFAQKQEVSNILLQQNIMADKIDQIYQILINNAKD